MGSPMVNGVLRSQEAAGGAGGPLRKVTPEKAKERVKESYQLREQSMKMSEGAGAWMENIEERPMPLN
ncbi:GL15163 [Drosophila persimilis]|uniref:GL15163 n=1 Tax=Drosophila persimilis TaxID=7234 RepID=B4H3Q2_DROPE|nr:GL15163 [Drosophila persimilis]